MTDDNPTAAYEEWFDLAVRRTVASIARGEGAEALEQDVARLSEEQAKAVLTANIARMALRTHETMEQIEQQITEGQLGDMADDVTLH